GLCEEEANGARSAGLADPRRLDRCSSRVEAGRGGQRGGRDGGGIVLDGGGGGGRGRRPPPPADGRGPTTRPERGRARRRARAAGPTRTRPLRSRPTHARYAASAFPMTVSMMWSKNAGSLPDERAHAIRTTAMAAAARITSAYSAVVCPSSR